jgi:hypothetical protein
MKYEKITRDQIKHKEYKNKLKTESRRIYGTERCYASHKPYKGLIASHIKPYKLCVLEGDEYSEFNINNGLLLAKAIDDYFDKLLITFDNNGKIIFSDKVPDEIKDEFSSYYLDDRIFNEERKDYMKLHRSLFYYKNYYNQSELCPANLRLEGLIIPYFDCGIKFLNGTSIILKDNYWEICPTMKLKQEFIERTNYEFKYYISNADFSCRLQQTSEYVLDWNINTYFNCPNSTVNIDNLNNVVCNNLFKISTANYNIQDGTPSIFLKIINEIFDYNELIIKSFRKIINISLRGHGFSKGVILYGDFSSINLIIEIIKQLLGSYFYEYPNPKILYKNIKTDNIPNCCFLYLKGENLKFNANNFNKIINNKFFPKTVLNINKYIPFISIGNKNIAIDNAIVFKFKRLQNNYDIYELMNVEGGKILKWFADAQADTNFEFDQFMDKINISTNEVTINEWLQNNCDTSESSVETAAAMLYENYALYMKRINMTPVSERKFFIELSKKHNKKRYSFGMVYVGIKIN